MVDYKNIGILLEKELASINEEAKAIEIRNIYIKKNLNPLYDKIKVASNEEKSKIGVEINNIKNIINEVVDKKIKSITKEKENLSHNVNYDISLNSSNFSLGAINPVNVVIDKIVQYFKNLHFTIQSGDEIVNTKYAFDNLNIPEFHPTRDTSETFYISDKIVLRSQTTASTALYVENNKEDDIRIMTYGNVYRNDDDDVTHSHQFCQIDFVWVKKGINIRNLKWLINGLLRHLYGPNTKTRYRLSNFPFTEPSFEVDVACPFCNGHGCSACKKTGWIEILGSGIFNEHVLKKANLVGKQAIAAGIGMERIVMLSYGFSDIRDLFSNNFYVLNQFRRRYK